MLVSGILSYSNYADAIQPEVEKLCGSKVKNAAIVMALRRYAEDLKGREKGQKPGNVEYQIVMGGKQVAFLAPTTILAEQHYRNFLNRTKDFPVRSAQLSRIVPPKEQKKTKLELVEGKIDVLFGTHRILQKDIIFKDLGLLVVDEEQRFGVKDKERIKEMRLAIDCLSLSATPIPRTLYMSLLKIRDMISERSASMRAS